MFEQLYFHKARRALDVHLKKYLPTFLPGGTYPNSIDGHLRLTDDHVLAAMQDDVANPESPRHDLASRILQRRFFRVLYERRPEDLKKNADAVGAVYRAARDRFGEDFVAHDTNISMDNPESSMPKPFRFAVERRDGAVVSSINLSQILDKMPKAVFDFVFIAPEFLEEGRTWLHENLTKIVSMKEPS